MKESLTTAYDTSLGWLKVNYPALIAGLGVGLIGGMALENNVDFFENADDLSSKEA